MSREGITERGRRRAEAAMWDECTVRRRTGKTTGAGGVITPTWTNVYAGFCRVQTHNDQGAQREVAQAIVIIARKELQVPISAPALKEGDEVTITVCRLDAQETGKSYVIRDVPSKSEATARRLTMVEVTS